VHFDRNAPLALERHGVEELLAHLPRVDRGRGLQDPVHQRRLAVVDMRDYREVTDKSLSAIFHNSIFYVRWQYYI